MIRPAHAALPVALVLALALPRGAAGSEEEIANWKKATIVAEVGSGFGEVEVTAVAGPRGAGLVSLSCKVKGKTITVPPNLLKELRGVQLHGLAVHSEAGYDKEPWLYVVLQRQPPPTGAVAQQVYFAIQGGKLKHRSLKTRDAKGQIKFEEKKL